MDRMGSFSEDTGGNMFQFALLADSLGVRAGWSQTVRLHERAQQARAGLWVLDVCHGNATVVGKPRKSWDGRSEAKPIDPDTSLDYRYLDYLAIGSVLYCSSSQGMSIINGKH
jgi:hypothetical protein